MKRRRYSPTASQESLIDLIKRADTRLSSSDAARLLSVIGQRVGALEMQVLDRDNVIFELRRDIAALRQQVAALKEKSCEA